VSAFFAAIKCPSKRWVSAMDHLVDVFQLNLSWMAGIFNDFVKVTKNIL
jgi:hypothetical protein